MKAGLVVSFAVNWKLIGTGDALLASVPLTELADWAPELRIIGALAAHGQFVPPAVSATVNENGVGLSAVPVNGVKVGLLSENVHSTLKETGTRCVSPLASVEVTFTVSSFAVTVKTPVRLGCAAVPPVAGIDRSTFEFWS